MAGSAAFSGLVAAETFLALQIIQQKPVHKVSDVQGVATTIHRLLMQNSSDEPYSPLRSETFFPCSNSPIPSFHFALCLTFSAVTRFMILALLVMVPQLARSYGAIAGSSGSLSFQKFPTHGRMPHVSIFVCF